MNLPTTRAGTALILALAVLGILTWPVWQWLWGEWMANDYYSHGILIPVVVLFLVYQRFRRDPKLVWSEGQGSNTGLVLTGVSLALYLLFLNNKAYYLAAFAMIGLIGGLVWTFGGTHVVRWLVFPIAYLGAHGTSAVCRAKHLSASHVYRYLLHRISSVLGPGSHDCRQCRDVAQRRPCGWRSV